MLVAVQGLMEHLFVHCPFLCLASPHLGWEEQLEQQCPTVLGAHWSCGFWGHVVCSWARLFPLCTFPIYRMSTVPLLGCPVLRERGAAALLGIQTLRGDSEPTLLLSSLDTPTALTQGLLLASLTAQVEAEAPASCRVHWGTSVASLSCPSPRMLLGKSLLHLAQPPLNRQGQLSVAACPHTPTPLPSPGPSPGTTPGGAVHIATACRVRTATALRTPCHIYTAWSAFGTHSTPLSRGEGCTPRRVGSPPSPARTGPGNL